MTHTQTAHRIKNELGLSDGQRRTDFVSGTRGSGWYNEQGEWIGWGDLNNAELEAIAIALMYGERVTILHEEDSYRHFLKATLPDNARAFRNEDAPGLGYLAEHAILIIETNAIYVVSSVLPPRNSEWRNGITYQVIDKKAAAEKILAGISH